MIEWLVRFIRCWQSPTDAVVAEVAERLGLPPSDYPAIASALGAMSARPTPAAQPVVNIDGVDMSRRVSALRITVSTEAGGCVDLAMTLDGQPMILRLMTTKFAEGIWQQIGEMEQGAKGND